MGSQHGACQTDDSTREGEASDERLAQGLLDEQRDQRVQASVCRCEVQGGIRIALEDGEKHRHGERHDGVHLQGALVSAEDADDDASWLCVSVECARVRVGSRRHYGLGAKAWLGKRFLLGGAWDAVQT